MKTQPNLSAIRKSLEEQRQILLERLEVEARSSRQPINPDRSDLAWQYSQGQRDSLLAARAEQQLAEVEAALARIHEGSYGKCSICGQPIHPLRLKTVPTTELCMQCKAGNKS